MRESEQLKKKQRDRDLDEGKAEESKRPPSNSVYLQQ